MFIITIKVAPIQNPINIVEKCLETIFKTLQKKIETYKLSFIGFDLFFYNLM